MYMYTVSNNEIQFHYAKKIGRLSGYNLQASSDILVDLTVLYTSVTKTKQMTLV
jgi:hypothetical protein